MYKHSEETTESFHARRAVRAHTQDVVDTPVSIGHVCHALALML
eukprot:COSAG02_NODE_7285_length_3084_cov_21.424121_3_plen_44_part_00